MFDSHRLLNTIIDHMLQLLPAESAALKRLDDIGDAEPSDALEPQILESGYPESGVHATNTTSSSSVSNTLRAAS